jgi:hydrogenase nickel incorporation protein HypA/HybF
VLVIFVTAHYPVLLHKFSRGRGRGLRNPESKAAARLGGSLHELSIATAILDRVAVEAKLHDGARFTKVGVRIGELSGVDPDALSFAFQALTVQSEWERLALEIEYCPRMQCCRQCHNEFRCAPCETECPACGAAETVLVAGEELDIAFLEMEDA